MVLVKKCSGLRLSQDDTQMTYCLHEVWSNTNFYNVCRYLTSGKDMLWPWALAWEASIESCILRNVRNSLAESMLELWDLAGARALAGTWELLLDSCTLQDVKIFSWLVLKGVFFSSTEHCRMSRSDKDGCPAFLSSCLSGPAAPRDIIFVSSPFGICAVLRFV